jgi:hypothetical protein
MEKLAILCWAEVILELFLSLKIFLPEEFSNLQSFYPSSTKSAGSNCLTRETCMLQTVLLMTNRQQETALQ